MDLWEALPEPERQLLFSPQSPCALPEPVAFGKGEELYREGCLAQLVQGSATVYRVDSSGARLTVRTVHAGELFGAASVFGAWKKGASSVQAQTGGQVRYLPEPLLCEILQRCPTVSLRYIQYLSDRIRFLNRRMDAFAAGTTQQRLYEFLSAQADREGVCHTETGMAHLARMLHVGRTSLYRDLAALEERELIRREGKRIVLCR